MKNSIYLVGILLSCYFTSCRSSYQVLNKGIAGNNSSDLLARVDKDVIANKPDLVILMVGSNDMINSKKFIRVNDYLSNLDSIVNLIKAGRPKVKLVVSSILPVEESYLFQRHDPKNFPDKPNVKIKQLNNAIEQFAKERNLIFIPLYDEFVRYGTDYTSPESLLVNSKNSSVDDGVHPTANGYKIIGDYFYQKLKENKLLRRNMVIVCFGDSITYGAFMPGRGTSEGDTYPAVLLRNLKKGKSVN